jgi:pyrroloquinoline quinone (PQQ) biosynthesis protein C
VTPTARRLIGECDLVGPRLAADRRCRERLDAWFDAWLEREKHLNEPLVDAFSAMPLQEWGAFILGHAAATHPWYDFLADRASLGVLREFLVEESRMPPFVPILRSVMGRLETEGARKALADNIHDELNPELHAELFNRMVSDVAACAGARDYTSADNDSEELAATNLIFHRCVVGSVDFAVGVLYATELMVPRRAECMLRALKRLGFGERAQEFMRIHAEVDGEHAAAWMDKVIRGEVADGHISKAGVAIGVTARLRSSEAYLAKAVLRLK